MKWLLVSENFPPKTGGSSRWFWGIYRRLPRADFVVAAGEDPRQEAFDRTHDLPVERLPLMLRTWALASFGGLAGYGRAVWRLRRMVREHEVGMVHCGRCLPEGVIALALKAWTGIPYLCYAHGEEVNRAPARGGGGLLDSRELRWLTGRVLRGAALVLANSRNTERILRTEWRLPAERVRVLHPGVDTRRFTPAPRQPAVRARLGWGDRPVILTVGRLQKRKGHDQLVRALAAIRRSIPSVLYAIVGDGEERGFLEQLVAREGAGDHVRFLGAVADDTLIACYQQCDLFILPNRQVGDDIEGFGMVLLEAQACGKPVVAGASGGTAETLRVPETGRLVCCDGPDELAAVAVDLLADPARLGRMGQSARRWVVERFDWTALSRQAEALFRAALPPRAFAPAVEPVHL